MIKNFSAEARWMWVTFNSLDGLLRALNEIKQTKPQPESLNWNLNIPPAGSGISMTIFSLLKDARSYMRKTHTGLNNIDHYFIKNLKVKYTLSLKNQCLG